MTYPLPQTFLIENPVLPLVLPINALLINFSVRAFPLILKYFVTYIHCLAFGTGVSIENSDNSDLCFQLVLLHSMTYFFFSIDHHHVLCAKFLMFFLSNIDKLLPYNPFGIISVLEALTSIERST